MLLLHSPAVGWPVIIQAPEPKQRWTVQKVHISVMKLELPIVSEKEKPQNHLLISMVLESIRESHVFYNWGGKSVPMLELLYGVWLQTFPHFHVRRQNRNYSQECVWGSDQACEWSWGFRGYFNRPASVVRTFGQGAIGWRPLCPIMPGSSGRGGSCPVRLIREGQSRSVQQACT